MLRWIMEKLGLRPRLEILDAEGDGIFAGILAQSLAATEQYNREATLPPRQRVVIPNNIEELGGDPNPRHGASLTRQ